MISILCPTRKRPAQLARMVQSVRATAKTAVEIVAYVDDDDQSYPADCASKVVRGPRIILTDCWNRCADVAQSDIFLQGNDDIIFRTPGWDVIVEKAFAEYPDKIVLVFGDDGTHKMGNCSPHPFLHRRWMETLGYFVPPYFSSDFGDLWNCQLACAIGRSKRLDFTIEHMHFMWGKADIDETTAERIKRHNAENPGAMYDALAAIRELGTERLQAAMRGVRAMDPKLTIMILTQPSRAGFLQRLLKCLKPQVANYPDVAIDIRIFDQNLSLGQNREAMRRAARGTYIVFIDDDDLVADDYVAKLYPLLDGVDQIGYQVQCYIDGVPLVPTYHSLRYGCWNSDKDGHYRDISHINPMRRELALRVAMEGGASEDSRWSDRMRALGVVKTEHYVDQVMYLYYFRSQKTDSLPVRQETRVEPVIQRAPCPSCGSNAVGMAGGMKNCNQCGYRW